MRLAVVLGVLASGSSVALLATSAWLITTAAEQPPVLTLMVAIVAVRTFGIGRGVFRYAERLAGHDAAYRMLGETRARVTARLEPLAPVGLAHLRSGDLLARLVLDVDAVLDRRLRVILPIAVAAITTTATVVLLVVLFPVAGAAVALTATVACTVVPWLVARTARRAECSVATVRGELASSVTETVLTAPDLVAFDGVSRALAVVEDADDRLRRAERRSAWSSGFGGALLVLCVGGASLAGLAAGAGAVRDGRLAAAVFAVVVLTPLALADVLGGVPAAAQMSVRVRASLGRVGELITTPAPVTEPARPTDVPSGRTLEVRGLSAGYGDGPDVLSGVDLELSAGARVVVTGASGSGKSTLAAVLLRLLEPRAGRVLLDGVDIATLAGDEVRSVVGSMTQESYVFDTSIEENLRLARPAATDAELQSALTAAGLGEFVAGLPHGLRTMAGEHGARLSGGERQRLALARMLLADFDILVLDEPTEHLDDVTGRALLKDLYAASTARSVLLLTHRPEQAPDADGGVQHISMPRRPRDS